MALTLSKVSATDLVKVVASLKGCQFVTVTTLSAPEMNKRGNAFYGRVLKLERKYLQVNYGFENSCQNRQERSGVERTYVAEPLPWGTWEVYPRVIDHKGGKYIRFYMYNNAPKTETTWLVDGREATAEEIAEFKPFIRVNKNSYAKQIAAGIDADKVCKPLTIKATNIVALNLQNAAYEVER